MARQSITLTKPNDEWLKALVESEEYGSKSEIVNELIRKARNDQERIEFVRAKLLLAEQSVENHGYSQNSPEGLLAKIKGKSLSGGDL